MKTFTTGYSAEVLRRRGAKPLWILSLTVSGITYYLSDVAVAISGWNGGVTTLAWVSSWGALSETCTGDLNEIRLADFSITCLKDPDATVSILDLCALDMESQPCRLWLWYRNLNAATDPPVCFFTGRVKDISGDNYAVKLDLEDDTYRLMGNLGTVAGQIQYPDIDTDDVGKLLPIVFGSVQKLPIINIVSGALTYLSANITAATTILPVTDGSQFLAGASIQIDAEIMTVSSSSATTITVTRAQGATLASTHQASSVVWERLTTFAYLVADHPVTSIGSVYGVVDKRIMDVSAYCTKYTGQAGSQLAPYGARAVVTIAGLIATPQAVALTGYVGGAISLSGAVSLTGNVFGGTPETLTGTIAGGTAETLSGTIQDYSISTGSHSHSTDNIVSQAATNTGVVGGGSTWTAALSPFTGFVSACSVSVSIYSTSGSSTIWINGGIARTVNPTPPQTFTVTSSVLISLVVVTSTTSSVVITGAVRDITTPATSTSSAATGVTKSLANNGSLTVLAGTAASNGSLAVSSGQAAANGTLSTVGGYTLNNSLSVNIAGNSVANTLVGTQLLCDVIGAYTSPVNVISYLLSRAGYGAAAVVDTMPTGYAINGAITTQGRLIDWLDTIAFQCRCFFRLINGSAKLFVQPDVLTSVKTISTVATDGGKSLLSWRRAPLTQVVNSITARYQRDWSNSGTEPYLAISSGSDSVSIARYGTQTKDTLFKFDFVTTQVMADSLVAFYLAQYATRRTYVDLVVYLDQISLEFGDVVTLPDTRVGVILNVGIQPGSIDQMDRIKLTVMV